MFPNATFFFFRYQRHLSLSSLFFSSLLPLSPSPLCLICSFQAFSWESIAPLSHEDEHCPSVAKQGPSGQKSKVQSNASGTPSVVNTRVRSLEVQMSSRARVFHYLFRPVLEQGPKRLTVVQVWGVDFASALKVDAWTCALATDGEVILRVVWARAKVYGVSVSLSVSVSFAPFSIPSLPLFSLSSCLLSFSSSFCPNLIPFRFFSVSSLHLLFVITVFFLSSAAVFVLWYR